MSGAIEKMECPKVASPWSDGNNERMHLCVQFLSSMTTQSFIEWPKVCKGSTQNHLRMHLKHDTPLHDPERMFNHDDFSYPYIEGDTLHSSYTTQLNSCMGTKKEVIYLVEIPVGKYELTPPDISGHPSILSMWLPEGDSHGNPTENKAFVMLFDLMIPKTEDTFTIRKEKARKQKNKSKSPTGRRRVG